MQEKSDGLVYNLPPSDYIDSFLELLEDSNDINDLVANQKFFNIDKLILEEYLNRFDEDDKINLESISVLVKMEKGLINECLKLIIKRRSELFKFKPKDFNYNPGMIFALSDANNKNLRDCLYAAVSEKFVHGTSTAFGTLREKETKLIKKKDSHNIFGISTEKLKLKDKSSFDSVLLIIKKNIVDKIIFIQMSSGPNCKNFSHAIQINNVKDWFKEICKNNLSNLNNFIKKKEKSEFDTIIKTLKSPIIDEDLIEVIVGQAYGDEGMTSSMMKTANVPVIRSDELWELITGIEGMNPFRAEKIAGIIALNIYKKDEVEETQKMSFWELIDYKLPYFEKEVKFEEFSID